MQLVVGRIAKAHGIHGDVAVDVRTDDPEYRFATGAAIDTDPPERGPLTVESTRWHSGRLLVHFRGIDDRTAAEGLRSVVLVADSATSAVPDDAEEFWDHDLIGIAAVTVGGEPLGAVADVLHPPGSDLLVIRRPDGAEVLVPFVAEFVPTVDVVTGNLVVDPPEGLLDL
jgi:16S rRNA processing protein RimM